MFDLSPQMLLSGYAQGIFPMAHEDGEIYWYDPDPRTIIPLKAFHISRSLHRTLRKKPFEIRYNHAFTAVMHACATSHGSTWISTDIITAYSHLHHIGFAHSVECWLNGSLVGGLYGVSLGGLFAGESMFHTATDASKVALVYLVRTLTASGFQLLDTQFTTDHLARFGAVEIPRDLYKARLAKALAVPAQFKNYVYPTHTH